MLQVTKLVNDAGMTYLRGRLKRIQKGFKTLSPAEAERSLLAYADEIERGFNRGESPFCEVHGNNSTTGRPELIQLDRERHFRDDVSSDGSGQAVRVAPPPTRCGIGSNAAALAAYRAVAAGTEPTAREVKRLRTEMQLTAATFGSLIFVTTRAVMRYEEGTRTMDMARWTLLGFRIGAFD